MWRFLATTLLLALVAYLEMNKLERNAVTKIFKMNFEVYGLVQGVFFRKHTKDFADALKLRGFVKNTPSGTVVGEAQGPLPDLEQLKLFLKDKGSPQSRIDKLSFDITPIEEYKYDTFTIIRRHNKKE